MKKMLQPIRDSTDHAVVIRHNLNPDDFMWLWAKYVQAPNLTKHCTASLRSCPVTLPNGKKSPYSQKFSKASNAAMAGTRRLVMDECKPEDYRAIYLCGVAARGYRAKRNYPYNLHAAIVPIPEASDHFHFEGYELEIENGRFTRIPGESELKPPHTSLPKEYTTCRIFRWAACVLPVLISGNQEERAQVLLRHP
jgi:hypothetical protein